MTKPILCLDFDGVIHSYTSGWYGAHFAGDPPVPGALEFLVAAHEHFRLAVYSSRSNQVGGIECMRTYIQFWARHEWGDDRSADPRLRDKIGHFNSMYNSLDWPTEKPPAFLTIDDRAVTFTGTWPAPLELLKFKPWNK